MRQPISILAFALVYATPVSAQTRMLDLVPAEPTAAALVVRSLDEFMKKEKDFMDETGFRFGLGATELFTAGIQMVGDRGLDGKGAAAILLISSEDPDLGPRLEDLVGIFPVTDLDAFAANFDLARGELKPKTIVEVKRKGLVGALYGRDKHVILANNRGVIERILRSKTLAEELSASQRKTLGEAEMLFHFAPRGLGSEWKTFVRNAEAELIRGDDPLEEKALKQLATAMESVRFVCAGIRLDQGIGFNLLAVFPKEGPAADFLATLRSGKKSSHVRGLPEGNIIAVQANAGDGTRNVFLARVVVNLLFKNILEPQQILSATDRPNFVGVFTEVWQRLQGSRLAVYLTRDERKLGLFSLVAILDAVDAAKFLAEMKTLAKIGDGSILDLAKTGKAEDIDIAKLVQDLGDKTYRVREAATTRLLLLGDAALPYLKEAMESKRELEFVRRAELTWTRISRVAAERRKELLFKDLPAFVRPSFTFVPKAESRGGYPVDIIKIKLGDKHKGLARHMEQLLGPQWDQMRLALHGNQVVVLLGSELDLFEATLINLKENREGLASSKALKSFSHHAAGERIGEFHFSVQTLLSLLEPERVRPPRGPFSSFALSAGAEQLQLDCFLPLGDVREIVEKTR